MCLAIPGKDYHQRSAKRYSHGVRAIRGIKRETCLDFVPEASIGDYVLVHVGFAMSCVDREEAERTYEMLESMGLLTG